MSDDSQTTHVQTLGEALPLEMARVRDVVMPPYRDIGPSGVPALMMMRHALDQAAQALAEGDVVAMIHWYRELKDFSL